MAQDDTQNPPSTGNGTLATEPLRVQLIVNAQYVKDLSFENPRAPNSLVQLKAAPDVSVDIDVKAQTLSPDLYEVVLHITAKAEAETEILFIVELTYGALMTAKNASEEQLSSMILIETPKLIFPFARAIIAAATRDGGFAPLLINPIDFVDLLRRQQAQIVSDAAATAAERA
jgi:preprotein translocase subunit SecB